MNDWQAALKAVLDKMDEKDERKPELSIKVSPAEGSRKKNRGRGALPLLKPTPRTHRKIVFEDDELPVRNWRRSPMER